MKSNVYQEYVEEYSTTPGDRETTSLEFMKLKRLDRIADFLEAINGNLSEMQEALTMLKECVGYVPPRGYMREGYYIFRIGGEVGTN